jgi:hypothetical protein
VAVLALALPALAAAFPGGPAGAPGGARPPGEAKAGFGVLVNAPKAFPGYTLIAPLNSTKTFLIDMRGRVVHTWQSDYHPAGCAYLLPNGHLLRGAHVDDTPLGVAPGRGGRVQEFTWEGELVWDYPCASKRELSHHDICKLPNGNVLLIVRQKKTAGEVAAAGGKAAGVILVDSVLEVRPAGKTGGKVVWAWHVWDHLIQDRDKSKPNYGDPAAHPERIDINSHGRNDFFAPLAKNKAALAKLRSLGYVGAAVPAARLQTDWTHVNSVAYHAAWDQVMLSVPQFSEVWVLDHGTTKSEAAGHKGGRRGKGGDLLYRWGNPGAYRAGKAGAVQLFFQHDAIWIPRGCPGEGHLLLFNNGQRRPGARYSSVDEVVLPVDKRGRYARKPGTAYGPERPVWSYAAPDKLSFYSEVMGGAQRLPNGNTLVCASTTAALFEVTPAKEVVWKYVIPPVRSRPKGLPFTAGHAKQLEALQQEVSARLGKILTAGQKERVRKELAGLEDFPPAGLVLTPFLRARVKLTAGQTRQVAGLRKEVLGRLREFLTPEQTTQYEKALRTTFRIRFPGQVGRPAAVGTAFRVYRYAPDYPGLAARDLTPGPTLEELQAKQARGAR